MFEELLAALGKQEKSPLTSLDLQTPGPSPRPLDVPAAARTAPPAIPNCRNMYFKDEAHKASVAAELQRQLQEWKERGQMPINLFYGVLPQQGLPVTKSTQDGKHTIIYLFDTPFAAQHVWRDWQPKPEIAGCRVGSVPMLAEKWISGGINAFSMSACGLCGPRNVFSGQSLLSIDKFTQCMGVEIVQRVFRARAQVLHAQKQAGPNPKGARASLEFLRDHLDVSNPYVHWMIAILAGMGGDMKANAESIATMEQFGPHFVGKLQGTSFDMSPGSQFATFPEAMMGLLMSYGLLKLQQNPPASSPPPASS